MSGYKLGLVLHIIGVIGWFVGIGLGIVAGVLSRRAKTIGQLQDLEILFRWMPILFGPASLVLLGGGMYLSWQRSLHHQSTGWAVVSLAAFLLLSVAGGVFGRQMSEAIKHELGRNPSDNIPAGLASKLRSRAVKAQSYYGIGGGLGILVLMVYKPSAIASVIVLIATVAVAMASAAVLERGAKA